MRRNLYESAGWPALRALLKSLPSGPKKSGAFVILAILLLAFFSFRPWDGPPAEPDLPASADGEICAVERVVDGDTLIVLSNGQRQRVRLIGCDTPETVKKGTPVERFGPEASEHTKKRVAEFGGTVLLESDGDRFDRYDRWPAPR